jgi:hypothetical protein
MSPELPELHVGISIAGGILLLCFLLMIGLEDYIFPLFAAYIFIVTPLLHYCLKTMLNRKIE